MASIHGATALVLRVWEHSFCFLVCVTPLRRAIKKSEAELTKQWSAQKNVQL